MPRWTGWVWTKPRRNSRSSMNPGSASSAGCGRKHEFEPASARRRPDQSKIDGIAAAGAEATPPTALRSRYRRPTMPAKPATRASPVRALPGHRQPETGPRAPVDLDGRADPRTTATDRWPPRPPRRPRPAGRAPGRLAVLHASRVTSKMVPRAATAPLREPWIPADRPG